MAPSSKNKPNNILGPPVTPEVDTSSSDKTRSWSASSDVAPFFVSETSSHACSDNKILREEADDSTAITTAKQFLLAMISPILWNRLHEELLNDHTFQEPRGSESFNMWKTPKGTFKFRVQPGKKSLNQKIWKNIWQRNWKIEHISDRHIRIYGKIMASWSRKNNFWTRRYLTELLFRRIQWMRENSIPFTKCNIPKIAQAGQNFQKYTIQLPRVSIINDYERRRTGPPRRSLSQIRDIRSRLSLAVDNRPSIVAEPDQENGIWMTNKGRKVHKILGPKVSSWHSYGQ